jgi:hypothetical protein
LCLGRLVPGTREIDSEKKIRPKRAAAGLPRLPALGILIQLTRKFKPVNAQIAVVYSRHAPNSFPENVWEPCFNLREMYTGKYRISSMFMQARTGSIPEENGTEKGFRIWACC